MSDPVYPVVPSAGRFYDEPFRVDRSAPGDAGNSVEDAAMLAGIARKYKALAPFIGDSAVIQSQDQGDDRQLEFYNPASAENPHPGHPGFELFKPMQGKAREDAVSADALHYLGGLKQDDSGPPVDPRWSSMREHLWNSRTPIQRAIDNSSFAEEHEPGQAIDDWAARNRKDAYVRAGVFPESNPDWNRGPSDPASWTPEQGELFGSMSDYLKNGKSSKTNRDMDLLTAIMASRKQR